MGALVLASVSPDILLLPWLSSFLLVLASAFATFLMSVAEISNVDHGSDLCMSISVLVTVSLTYALTTFSTMVGNPRAPQPLDPASLLFNINNSSRESTNIVGSMAKLASVSVDLAMAEETMYKGLTNPNLYMPIDYPYKEELVRSITKWHEQNVWSPWKMHAWLSKAQGLFDTIMEPLNSSKEAIEEIIASCAHMPKRSLLDRYLRTPKTPPGAVSLEMHYDIYFATLSSGLKRLISDTQDLHDHVRSLNSISRDIAIYKALARESINSRLQQTYRFTHDRQSAELQKRHLDSIVDPVYLRENDGFQFFIRLLKAYRDDFSKLKILKGTSLRRKIKCPETEGETTAVAVQIDLLDSAILILKVARAAVETTKLKQYEVFSQWASERGSRRWS